jgi:hypothetical protein
VVADRTGFFCACRRGHRFAPGKPVALGGVDGVFRNASFPQSVDKMGGFDRSVDVHPALFYPASLGDAPKGRWSSGIYERFYRPVAGFF